MTTPRTWSDHTAFEAWLARAQDQAFEREAHAEVPTDVALRVLAAGFLFCGLGWWFAPVGKDASVLTSMWALLLGTIFWCGALAAAAGLLARMRVGLWGAFVAAASFAFTVGIDPLADASTFQLTWVAQLACALAFLLVCSRALAATRPLR